MTSFFFFRDKNFFTVGFVKVYINKKKRLNPSEKCVFWCTGNKMAESIIMFANWKNIQGKKKDFI